ncbi:glutathione S-transferase L3-like protein [Tanacetum coccineum]
MMCHQGGCPRGKTVVVKVEEEEEEEGYDFDFDYALTKSNATSLTYYMAYAKRNKALHMATRKDHVQGAVMGVELADAYDNLLDYVKRVFAEELLTYTDMLNKIVHSSVRGDSVKEGCVAFDYLESALQRFEGSFFLGEISMVDFACVPFVERFQLFLQEVYKYDICTGMPKLATWIEELNKIDAYVETKDDPKYTIQIYKKRLLGQRDDVVDDAHTSFGDAGLSLLEWIF